MSSSATPGARSSRHASLELPEDRAPLRIGDGDRSVCEIDIDAASELPSAPPRKATVRKPKPADGAGAKATAARPAVARAIAASQLHDGAKGSVRRPDDEDLADA